MPKENEEESPKSKKTKKKQKKVESQKFLEVLESLEELEKEGKHVDIQICPHCMSPRVRRVRSMEGDMSGIIAYLPVKYECPDCGWRGRMVIKATNQLTTIKDV